MSAILNLKIATDDEIAHLLDEPEQIVSFLSERETPVQDDKIDLDKSWHGLHFLFTETAHDGQPPSCFLLKGGRQIGDIEVGYEPARFISTSEVAEFDGFLDAVDVQTLTQRYDPKRMNELEIYPEIWQGLREGEILPDLLVYLLENFRELRKFVNRAKVQSKNIILWLS